MFAFWEVLAPRRKLNLGRKPRWPSNLGILLIDALCVRGASEAGHTGMTIGIPLFRDPGELRLDRLLMQPFRNDRAAAERGVATRGHR